jgi:hypothetical protein
VEEIPHYLLIIKDLLLSIDNKGLGDGAMLCLQRMILGGFGRSIRTDPFSVRNSSQVPEKGVELGVVSLDYNSVND